MQDRNGVLKTTMLIPWFGSKVRMRRHILPIIARAERNAYIEPFGGAGGLFLGKPKEGFEVFNDINALVVNVFRVIRTDEGEAAFRRLADASPYSRALWKEYKELALSWISDKERLHQLKQRGRFADYDDDVLAAFAFFYCQRCGFAGKNMSSYGAANNKISLSKGSPQGNRANTYRRVVEYLDVYKARMKDAQIENVPYEEIFRIYDDKEALFYCDPPYDVISSKDYKTEWTRQNTKELVDLCVGAKGSVVLSCYDGEVYEPLEKYGFKKSAFAGYMSSCKTRYKKTVETVYYRLNRTK